ncbi:MAG: transketolase [Firmicutes bacterium]|nr:transketolase [Alicyclobacillaceae bacterium]MCL6496016.1 transketolase [Bacillota bacterium]
MAPHAPVLERGRAITVSELKDKARWLRLEVLRLIEQAGLGHYSSTMSCVEILLALYYHALRLCPTDPNWPDRDRFLLGKGHVAVGLWPILADLGYFPTQWLDEYGSARAALTDHPNMRWVPGVDFSSGSLGHNLSVGVGMSLAGRLKGQDYRVFVLLGDGEVQEGQVWEAAMAAGHYHLGNLVAIVDANRYSGGGATNDAMTIEPLPERFRAFGWQAEEVDGHDFAALIAALDALPPPSSDRPVCLVARTAKGHGVAMMEATPQRWHLGLLPPELRETVREEIARS